MTNASKSASQLIDARIDELGDWRGEMLRRLRAVVKEADPEVVEAWKWMGTPVWEHDGIICTGETYKSVVKMTFAKGAALADPAKLFNSSLEGNARRAIDFREGETINAAALKTLIRDAVTLNQTKPSGKRRARASTARTAAARPKAKAKAKARATAKPKAKATTKAKARAARPTRKAKAKAKPKAKAKARPAANARPERVVLLSGGNPQIAKADGDAPVQAYIAALPGWKRDVGARVDALVARTVPGVRRAVKWNSPFYGIEGQGWFLSFHSFTRYLKLAFFRGASLRPLPPGPSKSDDTRYLDIHEGDEIDTAQLATWVKQAAALPGWTPGGTA